MSLDITPAEALLVSPNAPASPQQFIGRRTIWVMSGACGVTVANTYLNQPLLSDFAAFFRATAEHASLVAMAAQIGYGTGLFFMVPLGDLMERRRLILVLTWSCAVVLIGMATAPTLAILILFQVLVGVTGVSSQILIPLGIDLTPPEKRGNTVGNLMAGLLCGILLARTAAGFIGDALGWRATYLIASAAMLITGFVLLAELPHRPPTLRMRYPKLMHSMLHLARTQPSLWTASIVSALSFGGFTAFWTTLSFLMKMQFHRGASEAGMFGIVGVIGALAAPLAGKLSDRRGSKFTVALSLIASSAAFIIMWHWVTIPSLIIGVLLMDLGVQSIQVAEQALVITLVPDARSRINTLYMVTRFMGGAAGSYLGAIAWAHAGWPGVCGASIAMLVIAGICHFLGPR